jgi:hypothetical protein
MDKINFDNSLNLNKQFEKLLGFFCSEGSHWSRSFPKDEKSSRQQIEERLGFKITEDEFKLLDYSFYPKKSENILSAGEVALTAISVTEDKGQFAKALVTGVISEFIMTGFCYYKEDIFSWIFKLPPDNKDKNKTWLFFLEKNIEDLLSAKSEILHKVARKILFYIGSREARILFDEAVSKKIINGLRKHEPDDSLPWFIEDCLNEKNIKDCLEKGGSKESIINCIRNAPLSPDFMINAELLDFIKNDFKPFKIAELKNSNMSSGDDHKFEMNEPLFCRFAPDRFIEFINEIGKKVEKADDEVLFLLIHYLFENEPILNRKNHQAIIKKWEKLNKDFDLLNEDQKHAEFETFKFVLSRSDAKVQLDYFLKRNKQALKLRDFEVWFAKFDDMNFVEDRISVFMEEPEKLFCLLWILSSHEYAVSPKLQTLLVNSLKHQDKLISLCVFKILYFSLNEIDINAGGLSEFLFCKEGSHHFESDYWISEIVCKHMPGLSFAEIKKRVLPKYWGTYIGKNGLREEDIDEYAKILDEILILNTQNLDYKGIIPDCEVEVDDKNLKSMVSISPNIFSLPSNKMEEIKSFFKNLKNPERDKSLLNEKQKQLKLFLEAQRKEGSVFLATILLKARLLKRSYKNFRI